MSMPKVLAGIRVVEQGTFITGPCAGMMLADLGADVVKVESPDGDPYRAYQGGQYSPHFQAYNRNKRSLTLDLKQSGDRQLFDGLVSEADVYIQNFRPGTAERLGAGPARLHELNPKLVYCSISGFGSSGPYVDRPSYDSVAQALSGFLSVVVDRDRPRFLGPALADAITGIYAAYGVLGALFERSRTGRGRVVEVSMLEAMAHFAVEPFAAFFALGEVPKSSDRPRLAQAHILRTGDGGLIAIHLSSLEKFWTGLTEALDAPELRGDPRFATRLLAHRELRGARRRARRALLAAPDRGMGRAARAARRALRAHQQRGRGREGSAGPPPRRDGAGRERAHGEGGGAARRAVRRRAGDDGHVRAAPGRAQRSHPLVRRVGRALARAGNDCRASRSQAGLRRLHAAAHHHRRKLSAARVADRPGEARRAFPAARAGPRAVAHPGGVPRRGAGRRDADGHQGPGRGGPRHHHRR
jgi:crotonobetainyl-CoA:carnitine CoA-transferase CaiB-like acyl-CoA transferase